MRTVARRSTMKLTKLPRFERGLLFKKSSIYFVRSVSLGDFASAKSFLQNSYLYADT